MNFINVFVDLVWYGFGWRILHKVERRRWIWFYNDEWVKWIFQLVVWLIFDFGSGQRMFMKGWRSSRWPRQEQICRKEKEKRLFPAKYDRILSLVVRNLGLCSFLFFIIKLWKLKQKIFWQKFLKFIYSFIMFFLSQNVVSKSKWRI